MNDTATLRIIKILARLRDEHWYACGRLRAEASAAEDEPTRQWLAGLAVDAANAGGRYSAQCQTFAKAHLATPSGDPGAI